MRKILILGVFIFFYSCEKSDMPNITVKSNNKIASGIQFNMLWNDSGVRKRSFIHLNQINQVVDPTTRPSLYELSDLSEADNVGNINHTYPLHYLTYRKLTNTTQYIQSPLETAPSFYLTSEGYQNSEYGGNGTNYPGFAIWVENGFTGNPLKFTMINSAKRLSIQSQQGVFPLHEVGIVFPHYWNEYWEAENHRWGFKEQYILSDLSELKPKFTVKLEHFNVYNTPNQTQTATTYLTADIRIEYHPIAIPGNVTPPNTLPVRTDLLGVIFSNPQNSDMFGTVNDEIFYKDFTSTSKKTILLQGNKLGLGIPNITSTSTPATIIEFNYLPLINSYLPPPPANTVGTVVGFDIYSSTRCADINFSLSEIYLNGKFN